MKEFEKHAQIVDERAGKLFADEVRRKAMAWRDEANDDIKAAGIKGEKIVAAAARPYTWSQKVVRGIVGLTFGAILVVVGVACGRFRRQIRMIRFIFFPAALRGQRSFTRLALFYVFGMLALFYCVIGGMPRVPHTPAHPIANTSGHFGGRR